ncbi:T9SS type A sorting domain-containing protein [Tamlana agarivorans]|uniref:T9SS type A sorting domain-containing protein n=1 Tax=Pseudotamlana agarivorans TaxID=481183 RepID=A0ACC5U9D2_9FLAO|nr:T9SS type A sorting domain-containing protein [Tamlana agarivorans]MBU2950912.1 T9SS type A sorting domain-containing protein [Tamlana agarivorans]
MNLKLTKSFFKSALLCCAAYGVAGLQTVEAQNPDPNQGLRAEWLRGTWGINWKPVDLYNGGHEGLSIKPFLNQISHIKTIDYIQVHLGESSIKSSVHMGPHDLLESFWEGDTDANGNPINLVVPRASYGIDPFLEIVKDIRAAGMKVMVYVNSSNMLSRDGNGGSNPDYIPNITERWKAWCDSNAQAQAFIASQPYHTGIWDANTSTYVNAEAQFPERKYMFCYAEFVLKEYAIRYGDLLDSWCFDSGSWMGMNGDSATNGVYEDQMIYNAFKAACHAGNPNAALSFQNSPERDTEDLNPFSEAVHADDFMFGHPYNGGRDGGSHTIGNPSLYSRNYAHIEKMKETNGYAHRGSDPQTWTWDDNVVAHYDPPMSTTSWNGGNTPALTDDEFNLWNLEAVQNGGAISWGLALAGKSSPDNNNLVARDWALLQLEGMDAHLMELETPGVPNWFRQETVLTEAKVGQAYTHIIEEGQDVWDPENVGVTNLTLSGAPAWLTIAKTSTGWTLSGTPTETVATSYTFDIVAQDADGSSTRTVNFEVTSDPNGFTNPGDGSPVWKTTTMDLPDGNATESYATLLVPDVDFYDFEGDALTISISAGPAWLKIEQLVGGEWQLSGEPAVGDIGDNNYTLSLSDGVHTTDAQAIITIGHPTRFTDSGNGTPVWITDSRTLGEGKVFEGYTYKLEELIDFYDFEGDALTLTKGAGADWLQLVDLGSGNWQLEGTPDEVDQGDQTFNITLSDGVNSSDSVFQITVTQADVVLENGYASVAIKATANTDYGVDQVAVLTSEVLTAFDGMATFQLSIDVTPETGKAILSGTSGGTATNQSWGLGGDGRDANKSNMFYGDALDSATLSNIQLVSFNANGGTLTAADFQDMTIESLLIMNGQSPDKDAVNITTSAGLSELGYLGSNPFSLDVNKVDDLTIASGTSLSMTTNKWSVGEIIVAINFNHLLSVADNDSDMTGFRLFPNPAQAQLNFNMPMQNINIIDVTGKLIKSISEQTETINISELASGMYFLKGQNGAGVSIVKRFVKRN